MIEVFLFNFDENVFAHVTFQGTENRFKVAANEPSTDFLQTNIQLEVA